MLDKAKKYLTKIQLKNRQRAINKQSQRDGLTDEILQKQVGINKLGHEHDISDETKRIYKNYVQ